MKFLATLGLLALSVQSVVSQISIAIADNGPYQLQCNNGQWALFGQGYTVAVTVTGGGVTNTGAPMDENGAPQVTIESLWFINNVAAPVQTSGTFNIDNSATAGNMWSFTLKNDQAVIGGTILVTPPTPCTFGQTPPSITTSFSTTSRVITPGGMGVPANVNAIPTVVNKLNAANVATGTATMKPPNQAPSVATMLPTKVAPTQPAVQPAMTGGKAGISVAIADMNTFKPQCNNGAWTLFGQGFQVAITVTDAAGNANTGAPADENAAPMMTINNLYWVNGVAVPVTTTNTFNVGNSQNNGNAWIFNLLNDQPNVGGNIALQTTPPCTQGQAAPTITTAFTTTSMVTTPGGNGFAAGITAVPTIVNKVNPANVQPVNGAPTIRTPTNKPTVTPTTAAPTVPPTNCVLKVPADPLTPQGLATPYTVTGCTQTLASGTFVQGVVLDLDTGAISVYNPLVINAGTQPAIVPKAPTLPANNVVGLWFGTNGMTTTLVSASNTVDTLVQGDCVNGGGAPFSIFGQYAACNGRAFFDAATNLINAGKLVIPPLGNDFAGKLCPTTHDFAIVDQDQSDNTDTTYLVVTATGQTAQNTPQNQATLTKQGKAFTVIDNGSDELLITLVQQAIGCTKWLVTDLADPTGATKVASLPTNELQARLNPMPAAFIPAADPMVLNGAGAMDVNKVNAFRTTVGQAPITSLAQASTTTYCNNMYVIGAPKIMGWTTKTMLAPAPDFAAALAPTLAGVLVARFGAAVADGGLNCVALLNKPNPLIAATVAAFMAPSAADMTPMDMMNLNDMTPDMSAQVGGVQQLAVDANGNVICPTTGADPNAFSGTWFGVGAGVGFGLGVVVIGAIVYSQRNSQDSTQKRNNAMAMATSV